MCEKCLEMQSERDAALAQVVVLKERLEGHACHYNYGDGKCDDCELLARTSAIQEDRLCAKLAEAEAKLMALKAELEDAFACNRELEIDKQLVDYDLKDAQSERDALKAELEEAKVVQAMPSDSRNASQAAMDDIQELCGFYDTPWEYPGQVVRDVERLKSERDAALAQGKEAAEAVTLLREQLGIALSLLKAASNGESVSASDVPALLQALRNAIAAHKDTSAIAQQFVENVRREVSADLRRALRDYGRHIAPIPELGIEGCAYDPEKETACTCGLAAILGMKDE